MLRIQVMTAHSILDAKSASDIGGYAAYHHQNVSST
jgi:hypothetical protein